VGKEKGVVAEGVVRWVEGKEEEIRQQEESWSGSPEGELHK